MRVLSGLLCGTVFLGFSLNVGAQSSHMSSAFKKPAHLKCDNRVEPLGIDSKEPQFSWQLQDSRFGARQTAYEIQVATKPALLASNKPDVWDSGRVHSDHSVGVAYAGPVLTAQQRYYWRVRVWDKDAKPYPASEVTWWETGLMTAENWRAKWIGSEEEEHKRIRESGAEWITNVGHPTDKVTGQSQHDFRLTFQVPSSVKRAVLYVTGKDTAAAWVNGKQVLMAQPLPPWKQAPWQTYFKQDVSGDLQPGTNVLAVEVTLYAANPSGMVLVDNNRTPMNACLYVEMNDGTTAVYKSDATWKAALNAQGDWQAAGYADAAWENAMDYVIPNSPLAEKLGNPWPTDTVKLLRRSFDVSQRVVSARLYATALGAYQFHINGHRVGDQVLSPGWMDYRVQVPYQVYDVTAELKEGKNAIGAYLAPGWYTTPLRWFREGYNYGKTSPALKAQLRIQHADGSVEWIATDESWKADVSPILKAEIYDGETYDARREQQGWDTADFSDAQWKPADLIQPVEPALIPQFFEPIRVEKTLSAKTLTSPKSGIYIYDFGQNLSGVARLQVQGAAGTDVQLRFAEVLNDDGTLYVDNLRTAKATDHYILAGKGVEEFQPAFTFHGFRYVEVSGVQEKPGLEAVKAVVFHTDAPFTAQLHTGSAMLNQLWSNILWGQRSNFLSVPTDCPQRDERLGWTADAQVFWRAASYNMNLAEFTKKFSMDMRGTQNGTEMYGIFAPGASLPNPGYAAGWSDAGVIIPWTGWLHSGDTRIIDQNWVAMEKYLAAIQTANPDYLWKNKFGIPFGDWLSPEGPTQEPLVATAYWAYDVTLMRQMAHATGRSDDEKKYSELFGNIKSAFMQAFVRQDGFVQGADNGPSPFGQINNPEAKSQGGDTQTGYVLALEMNLVPDSLRSAVADKLVGKIEANHWRLNTGFLGTPYLLAVLVDTGHSDVAYRLLLNTEYPSWGYLVGHGATTMWERWNGDQKRDDPSMNSYNHYAYGAVADWVYRYAAGVDVMPSDAGFHTIYLHPNFDLRLGSLDFSYMSPYGEIKSSWTAHDHEVEWKVTIPANATARLPLSSDRAAHFMIDGVKLANSPKVHQDADTYELVAGTYSMKATLP